MILSTLHVDKIASCHRTEWLNSSVSDTIINLNVRTITDSRELDKILNRNNTKRWQHSDALVPAWCVSGVDPLTDEHTLQGVQVKPDTPPIGKDGRIQKYLGAKEFEASPLFLDTGIRGYWKSVIDDILKGIIVTEGAKKAGSGLSIGLPTISIPGVSTCRKKGRLHQLLEIFAVLGRTFYLCFDNDVLTKPPVQKALVGLAKELSAKGSKVMVVKLPEGNAKGMDDFIALHGGEAFKKLVEESLTFEEWKEEIDAQADESPNKPKKSRLARNFDLINQYWGDSLKYNTLKKRVELQGTELPADDVRLIVAREFDVDMTATDAHTVVRSIARADSYSPVVDYLNEVESKFPEIDPTFLDGLAQDYFSTSDPMHSVYFKKFLVSAVARARKPGEKVDSVFMLASPKQGLYKSTFFRILFSDDWFSDQLGGDFSDKDEKMKMHRYWCHEWSEFETVYKKKDVATLKNFITSVQDVFRAPYDRDMTSYYRPCVFVGTTNEQEILNDPTGDRRFWIITVGKKIPLLQVMRDRDKIWAAANALYKSGFEWKLTDEEEERREILNRDYHSVDPWLEVIEEFITPGQSFVSTQNLYKLLDIDLSKRDPLTARRVSNVMRRLGWISGREKINNHWKRGWILENIENKIWSDTDDFNGSMDQPFYERVLADPLNSFQDDSNGSMDQPFYERVLADPLNDSLTFVRDQLSENVLNTTLRKVIPEIHCDPLKFIPMDQPEPSNSKGDPLIHWKPQNLAKNNSSKSSEISSSSTENQGLQADPLKNTLKSLRDQLPSSVSDATSGELAPLEISEPTENPSKDKHPTAQKIDYQFWLIDPTTLRFTIPSQFGDITCTAEPTATILNKAKMKAGYLCRVTWHWTNGTKAAVEDVPIEAVTGKKDFEALAQRIAKEWVNEQIAAALPPAFQISVDGPLGCSTVDITPLKARTDNRVQYRLAYKFADYTIHREEKPAEGNAGAEAIARERITLWQNEAIAKSQFKRGDLVEIMSDRKLKGQFVVDIVDSNGVLVSQPKLKNGFSKPIGTFQPDQLRKLD
ncbi:VapE domain-containing protein [Nostoc sp. ChiVER01]|uniref:VapE domain-containing protein n=1 Tax=Nostoc sp. ChiVER01 TaxID=3075382 RepID=UPI002AD300E7|nr:VapE domain-containing protein [Nostoc sp. ChiVER01]MDZ8227538.1 VapE family protein [Nostoc sp. ChiVER01]